MFILVETGQRYALKENLEGLNWQQATTNVYSFNTIAALLYHMHFYVRAVGSVLDRGTAQCQR